jgi:hypothetical protein
MCRARPLVLGLWSRGSRHRVRAHKLCCWPRRSTAHVHSTDPRRSIAHVHSTEPVFHCACSQYRPSAFYCACSQYRTCVPLRMFTVQTPPPPGVLLRMFTVQTLGVALCMLGGRGRSSGLHCACSRYRRPYFTHSFPQSSTTSAKDGRQLHSSQIVTLSLQSSILHAILLLGWLP